MMDKEMMGLWSRRDTRDAVVAAMAVAIASALAVGLDFFDGLVQWLERYEDYEVDEILVSLLLAGLAFGWISHRRWGDFRREERVRRLREDQLREMRDRFESILLAAEEGILGLDRADRIVFCNPAAAHLVGREPQDLLGRARGDALYDEPAAFDPQDCPFLESMDAGIVPLRRDQIFWRKDGTCFPAEFAVSPRGDEGSVLVFRDIGDRVRTELAATQKSRALAASNADLQNFVYAVSHDLREPLRGVSSFLQLLERRLAGRLDQPEQEYLGFAVDGARRMQRMISDLVEFSRVDTHGESFQPLEGAAAVEAALRNLEVAIREAGARIVIETPMPRLFGDESQVVRVFQNLIANAIKFRDPARPAEVRLRAEARRGEFAFAVEDNGIGIDPQYLERIFEVFQRLHTQEEFEGSGVGLAVVKRIVERHGGRVWVQSDPGKGSCFQFTLRAASAASTEAA